MTKNDGIYSRYFTALSGDGRYSLKVSAQGRNQTIRLGRRQNRALYVPGYIENGKDIRLIDTYVISMCVGSKKYSKWDHLDSQQ